MESCKKLPEPFDPDRGVNPKPSNLHRREL
jgi:hypothetical protein